MHFVLAPSALDYVLPVLANKEHWLTEKDIQNKSLWEGTTTYKHWDYYSVILRDFDL